MFATCEARAALDILPPDAARRLEAAISSSAYYSESAYGRDVASMRTFVKKRFWWDKRRDEMLLALDAMVDRLLAEGVLLPSGYHRDNASMVEATYPTAHGVSFVRHEGAGTPAAAAVFRERWAARVGRALSAEQQARLSELFAMCRQLGRPVSTAHGTLVVLQRQTRFATAAVTRAEVGAAGPIPKEALVFAVADNGAVRAYRGTETALSVEFLPDDLRVSCNLAGLRRAVAVEASSVVLPYTRLDIPAAVDYSFDWPGVDAWLGFRLPAMVRRALETALARRGRRQRKQVSSAMLHLHLDAEVTRAAARLASRKVTVQQYSTFAPARERTAQWRRQATDSFPLLASTIVSSAAVRRAVDAGEELVAPLSEATGLRPAVLRRVGRLHWQRVGVATATAIAKGEKRFATVLNACPLERLPRSRADWMMAAKLADNLSNLRSPLSDAAVSATIASASRDWSAPAPEVYRINDMLSDVCLQVGHALADVDPGLSAVGWRWHEPKPVLALMRAIISTAPSLAWLGECSDLWHQRLAGLHRRLAEIGLGARTDGVPTAWLPLDAPFSAPGGGGLRFLTTRAHLIAESDKMRHCVRIYGGACMFDGSHIAEIDGAEGGRSTVELRADARKGEWRLRVVQHYTYDDRAPPADCTAMLEAFLAARRAELDYDGIEAARRERLRYRRLVEGGPGLDYDAGDPQQCEAVIALYRPFLPGPLRRAGRTEMAGMAVGMVSQLPI